MSSAGDNGNRHSEPVKQETGGARADRLDAIRTIVPEAFVENQIDVRKLREALGGDAGDDSAERYTFSWAGRRNAIRILQIPTRATLSPSEDESVAWETTEHVFIEGDSLEVLKLLYKPYSNRIKLIYLDPPFMRWGERMPPA